MNRNNLADISVVIALFSLIIFVTLAAAYTVYYLIALVSLPTLYIQIMGIDLLLTVASGFLALLLDNR